MRSSAKKSSFKKKAGASWLTKYKPRALAINRQAPGLGRSLKTRLETTFFFNLTANGATGVWTGYLNLGSCFKPCGDIATLQPTGFDQLKAFYARYLVTGATVELDFVGNYTDTNYGSWLVCAYPSTVTTPMTTFQGAASQPGSKSVLCPPHETRTLKFKLNAQQVIGSRLPPVAEDAGALVGANPANGQNMVLPIFIQYFMNVGATGMVRARIIQDVIFDQRIQVVDA